MSRTPRAEQYLGCSVPWAALDPRPDSFYIALKCRFYLKRHLLPKAPVQQKDPQGCQRALGQPPAVHGMPPGLRQALKSGLVYGLPGEYWLGSLQSPNVETSP